MPRLAPLLLAALLSAACHSPTTEENDGGGASPDASLPEPGDAGPDAAGADAAPSPDAGERTDSGDPADAALFDAADPGDTGTPEPGPDAGADAGLDPACELEATGAGWVAFASRREGQYDLHLVRADGSCQRALTSDPSDELYPAWSSDGSRLAYVTTAGGKLAIHLLDPATGVDAPLELGTLGATSPAFSPDGTWLAFEGRVAGSTRGDIYKIAVAGGIPIPLTAVADADSEGGPSWSPDGQTVYFVSNKGGPYEIWSVKADGTGAARLSTGSKILGKPAVAPDGRTLVFSRLAASGNSAELAQIDVATKAITPLASAEESEPAFDSTGTRLVVSSWRFGTLDLVLLSMPGATNPLRLTNDIFTDGAPAFRP